MDVSIRLIFIFFFLPFFSQQLFLKGLCYNIWWPIFYFFLSFVEEKEKSELREVEQTKRSKEQISQTKREREEKDVRAHSDEPAGAQRTHKMRT